VKRFVGTATTGGVIMAYLHCHSCGWEQDDFWTLCFKITWRKWRKSFWKLGLDIGYNPISRLLDDLKWLWVPRWIGLDDWIIEDLTIYTGVAAKKRTVTKIIDQRKANIRMAGALDVFECKETQVFSWSWLLLETVKEGKNFRRMKWWTWKAWKRDKDTAVCPECGARNFDID
jgi:hypothetical protein